MLTRRSFLAWFPLSACAASVAASSLPTIRAPFSDDEHEISIWRVRWMDWRIPANQYVKFGYWFAYLPRPGVAAAQMPDGDYRHWVSPTTGVLQRCQDFGMIDTSRADDSWPVSLRESSEAFERAKRRAYWQLVDALAVGGRA